MRTQTPQKMELFAHALRMVILGVFGVFVSVSLLSLAAPNHTAAATSSTINFQARLETATGAIAPDGTYNVEFKLYDAATSGSLLWTEDHLNNTSTGVRVANGYLTVNLGSVTAFGNLNWNQQMWLTMNVGSTNPTCTPFSSCSPDGEMTPRMQLTAVPYAFQAGELGNGTNRATLDSSGNLQFQQASTIKELGAASGTVLTVQGGAATSGTNVGGNLLLQGGAGASTGASGSVIVKSNGNNSTTAFQVQNASGVTLLNADTVNSSVTIGSTATASATVSMLQLGSTAISSGSANGTYLGLNAPTAFNGDLVDIQQANGKVFQIVSQANQTVNGLKLLPGISGTGGVSLIPINSGANNGDLTISANGNATLTLNVQGSGAVNIGQSYAGNTSTTSIGDNTSGTVVNIQGGPTVNVGAVGSSASASTIHIADTTGAANQAVTIASGQSGAGNTAVVTIGSTNANTGSVTTIQGGGNTTAAILLTPNTAGGVMIGASAGTGTITLGRSTATNTINIGSAAGSGATQSINIGTSATASSTTNVVIGSTIAGTTTLQSAGGVAISTLGTTNSVTYLCRNGSNIIAACQTNATGSAFVQGGNNFGGNATLGTTGAAQTLTIATGGTNRLTLDTSNNFTFQQAATTTINIAAATSGTQLTIQGGAANSGTNVGGNLLLQGGAGNSTGASGSVIVKSNTNNSATAFQVQNASSAALLTVDTTNNALVVGPDGTTTAMTIRGGAATGTNVAGSNLTFDASNGTGAGGSGALIFRTASGSGTPQVDSVSSTRSSTSVTTFSWNHTVGTQSNRLLVVEVAMGGTSASSVTYGGTALTRLSQVSDGATLAHTEIWYLLAPVSGTAQITVTLPSNDGIVGGSMSYYNVSQATPFGTAVTNSGNGKTASVTVTSTDSSKVVIGSISFQAVTGFWTSSNTELWNYGAYNGGAGSSATGGSPSTVMTWTNSSTGERWALIGVAINAAAGSPTSSDSMADRLHISPNGNVGIGNASPQYTLDVVGTASIKAGSTTAFQVQDASGLNMLVADTANGKVGVGINVPQNTFSVSPIDYQTGTAKRTNGSAALVGTGTTWTNTMPGDIIVFADGTTNFVASFTDATHITMGSTYTGMTDAAPIAYRFHKQALDVSSSGLVGIGQTNPDAALSVRSANQNAVVNIYGVSSGTDYGAIQVSSQGGLTNPSSRSLILQPNAGSVGIGTASASALLTVGGSTGEIARFGANAGSTDSSYITAAGGRAMFGHDGANHIVLQGNSGKDMQFQVNSNTYGSGTAAMTILSTSQVGIGSGATSPLRTLDVKGGTLTLANAATYAFGVGNSSLGDFTIGSDASNIYLQSWNSKPLIINNQGNNVYLAPNSSVGIGAASASRTLDVNGNWGGNEVNDVVNDPVNSSTRNVSTPALVYHFRAVKTTGNASATLTWNITGIPDVDGSYAYLLVDVGKTANIGTSAQQCITFIRVNSSANLMASALCTSVGNSADNQYRQFMVMRINGSWTVFNNTTSTTTTGTYPYLADLAEQYSSTQGLEPGEIVSIAPGGYKNVERSTSPAQSSLLGIVSTAPWQDIGSDEPGYPIALTGRVPVKVNLEGGVIHKGDKITSSSTPGVGMKANIPGMIVGTALEDYNGIGTGTIQVFVGLSYYNPLTDSNIQGTATFSNLNVSGAATIQTLTVTGIATFQSNIIVNGHIITGGNTPTAEALPAAGADWYGNIDASCVVTGNDTSGVVTLTAGSHALTEGDQCAITFAVPFTNTPHPVLTALNRDSVAAGFYVSATTDGIVLSFYSQPQPGHIYSFSFVDLQ